MDKFCRLAALIGNDNLEKLNNTAVAVIGLGGVGSTACVTLARSGIGKLIVQDFDKVSISNFNRQIIANDDTVNEYKVDAMKEMIKKINPNCEVVTLNEKFDDNSSLFSYQFSYLIDAIDSLDNKFLLIKTCLEKDIKFISSMGTAKKLDIKKLSIIDINKTTYDPIAKIIRKKMRDGNIKAHFNVLSSIEEPISSKELGSYMPVTSTAGLMLADYIIKEILNN